MPFVNVFFNKNSWDDLLGVGFNVGHLGEGSGLCYWHYQWRFWFAVALVDNVNNTSLTPWYHQLTEVADVRTKPFKGMSKEA